MEQSSQWKNCQGDIKTVFYDRSIKIEFFAGTFVRNIWMWYTFNLERKTGSNTMNISSYAKLVTGNFVPGTLC